MTELKTLEDIELWNIEMRGRSGSVIISDLKQEAIKHIKQLTKEYDAWYRQPIIKCGDFTPLKLLSKIDWIKHFFNLSKEDLK